MQLSQHITTLGATCCACLATLLQCAGTYWVLKIALVRMWGHNIVAQAWPNNYNIMQHPQMLHEKFDHFIFELTTPNMLQHVPACCNRVAKCVQHVAPKNVAICCIDMLRLFGWGFSIKLHALEKLRGLN